MNVAELLDGHRVCICTGPGGVGKTTTSAAIALGMAAQGMKVAVVTIDPARRLANALGLEQLSNEPALVSHERLDDHGLTVTGELWAMMLDSKQTFDELIDHVSPNPERAEEIKSNRVYQQLSTAVSGSQEFTAVSKLFELATEGGFDLIVLDTPPSRNALDFFDAPNRLTSFLEGKALQALLKPTGLGMRLLGLGVAPLMSGLRRVTGVDLISDLTTFFTLLGDMTDTFSVRARHVDALLRAPETAFLAVTNAQAAPVHEAITLHRTLAGNGMTLTGAIVNRFHPPVLCDGTLDAIAEITPLLGDELATKVAASAAEHDVLARRDAANVERLRAGLGDEPLLIVPEFDEDVHDVDGLLRVHTHLFG
jgi:anion-transporting  ArsA/GET3 family ATPase